MDKTNLIDLEAFKHDKNLETMEIRLARLWATASKKFFPTTILQRELELLKAEPYEGLTTGGAITLYNRESLRYVKPCGPTMAFDAKVHEGDVLICIDHIEIDDVKIFPVAGSLVELEVHARTARDCANIIVQHTTVVKHDKRVVETCDVDECNKARIPYINAVRLRKFLGESTTNVMKARDEIFAILSDKKNAPHLILSVSMLYSSRELELYRQVSKQMLEFYRREVVKRKKNKDMTIWPKIQDAYILSPGPFYYKMGLSTEQIWRFYHASLVALGGVEGYGKVNKGYYRYDMSFFFLEEIDRATDVIMISQKFGYPSVTLRTADIRLATILIRNGITVYCSSLTSKRQHNGRVGVYEKGDLKTFVYYETRQHFPRVCSYGVNMPTPELIHAKDPTYVLEYIPNYNVQGSQYLPSCRASEGYCIKTNCPGMGVDLVALRERFLKAIWYRNWYIYTRYTFVAHDSYQSWFDTAWYYPCVSEKLERDIYEQVYDEERGVKIKLQAIKMTQKEYDETPVYYDIRELTLEEQCDIISFMEKMSFDDLVQLEEYVITAKVPVDHRVFPLYQSWTQRELLDRVQQIINETPAPSYEYFNNEEDEYVDIFQYGDDHVFWG
jgi:hypothetical protein